MHIRIPPARQYNRTAARAVHFVERTGQRSPLLDFVLLPSPFGRARSARRHRIAVAYNELVARYLLPLFATCRSRYRPRTSLAAFRSSLRPLSSACPFVRPFDIVPLPCTSGAREKRKPAGQKFITREQQVITLRADFSERLRGGKEREHRGTTSWFSR